MTERPERKMLLKYVHRSLVFIEVALLSASGRSQRPWGPTAVTGCSPSLFVCAGLAGDRHRGALGCGKGSLWSRPSMGCLLLEEGLSVEQSRQHHTMTENRQAATTAQATPVSRGKSSTPQPLHGDAAQAAVAAGVGPTGVRPDPPPSSSLKQEWQRPTLTPLSFLKLVLACTWLHWFWESLGPYPGACSCSFCSCSWTASISWEPAVAHQSAKQGIIMA